MQQAGALGGRRVETKLGRHDTAQVSDLERMVQHILAVGSTVAQTTERKLKLVMQVMNAGIERCLSARLGNLLVHVVFQPCRTSLRCAQGECGRRQ